MTSAVPAAQSDSRRDQLITLKLPITADKPTSWALEAKPDATDEQKARVKAWLRE